MKAVFLGDIPLGGGTSASSSKAVTDFLLFTAADGIFEKPVFRGLIEANGARAGLRFEAERIGRQGTDQPGVDPFTLSLSMYLAHYENGLDFGELKGDRGGGIFGGSEDHTAILLGAGGASRIQENLEWYVGEGDVLSAERKGEKMAVRFARFPFLDYQVLSPVRAGISRVNLVLRPDDTFFTDHCGGKGRRIFPEAEISFSFQETPEGTARAVVAAERFCGGDDFIVLNGDNNYPERIVRMFVSPPSSLSSMVAFDVSEFGESAHNKVGSFAVIRTSGGKLGDIVEKPRELLRHAPRKPGEYELPDAMKLFMERGNEILVYYAKGEVQRPHKGRGHRDRRAGDRGTLSLAIEELERRYARTHPHSRALHRRRN